METYFSELITKEFNSCNISSVKAATYLKLYFLTYVNFKELLLKTRFSEQIYVVFITLCTEVAINITLSQFSINITCFNHVAKNIP